MIGLTICRFLSLFFHTDYVISATGITRQVQKSIHKQNHRYFDKMKQRRKSFQSLHWFRTLMASTPQHKDKFIKMLNDRYRDFASYGRLHEFYELGLHKSKDLDTFRKINRQMNNFKFKWSKRNKVKIALHQDFNFTSHVNSTERRVAQIESILQFEHTMRTLQLKVCKSCREYRLQFDSNLTIDGERSDDPSLNRFLPDSIKLILCSNCARKGHLNKKGKDHFKQSNLLPVWFERNADGTFKLDESGEKISRYDVPDELKSLTMAERLLIRRCAPFVPLVHVAAGVTGMKGHCVCYPQDITELCKDLPNRKEEIITFIRKVGGHDTRRLTSHIDAFKVRKSKVLTALRWLKIHNIHYHDITITESNLDWMNGAEESCIPITVEEHCFDEDADNDGIISKKATVSSTQTESTNTDEVMEYHGITLNSTPFSPSARQEHSINQIKNTVIESTSGEGLMNFPPTDAFDPISEFNVEEYFMCNAFPWLFPGGVADIYDEVRGKEDILSWAKHLMKFMDGRFEQDHIWCLYVCNIASRHHNYKRGSYFVNNPERFGSLPTVEELQEQIKKGDTKVLDRISWFCTSNLPGCDAWWRSKTEEVHSWIDYHIGEGHGPPTHFITLSCAEFWWPDLRRLVADMETLNGNHEQAKKIKNNDFSAIATSVRKYPLMVSEFFMLRATLFIETTLKKIIDLLYYIGSIEFAPGRGQIHMHLIAIMRDKAFLHEFFNAKTEAQKTSVLESYAVDSLGMTADINVNDTPTSNDVQQAKRNLATCYHEQGCTHKDAENLCQACMMHFCNDYCMAKQPIKDGGKRYCKKARHGVEQDPVGSCITPGLPLTNVSYLAVTENGVESLFLKRTKSRKVNQTSIPVLQAWRGNIDIQLIMYRSDPRHPDINEIQGLVRYVVSYITKKGYRLKEEKKMMEDVILSIDKTTVDGFGTVMKKCMNMLSSNKVLSIQQAQYSVMQLPLVVSSELPHYLQTTTKMKLCMNSQTSPLYDLKTTYARRESEYKSMSLAEFFYKVHQKRLIQSNALRNDYLKDSNLVLPPRTPILVPRGRNVRPVYPATFEYARAMIMMHVPWSNSHPLDFSDKSKTIATFHRYLASKSFPTSVTAQYNRVEYYHKHGNIEVVSKKTIPTNIEQDDNDDEYSDFRVFARAMNHFTSDKPVPCSIGDLSFDVGLEHDWTVTSSSHMIRDTTVSGDLYMEWIKNRYVKAYCTDNDTNDEHDHNNTDYTMDANNQYNFDTLSADQKNIALATIITIFKFLSNAHDYNPLRATVLGAGGCGKSHLIHTIQQLIDNYCRGNMSCYCSAPSGSAAYRIGGSTVHSFASINVPAPWQELSDESRTLMKQKLKYILCWIIDERSLLGAKTIAAAERNLQETVFNEHSKNIPWGGIPVIILFGDDYQLPPVLVDGAITLFGKKDQLKRNLSRKKATRQSSQSQSFTHIGGDILINELTERTFLLDKNFRQRDTSANSNQSLFRGILNRIRTCQQTEEDCKMIMSLRLSCIKDHAFRQFIENHKKTLYLFATNKPKNEKNLKMLHKLSTETNEPVAMINARFMHTSGSQTGLLSHFDMKTITLSTPLCIGCKVAIDSLNICPTWGLYNGCLGTVVDIIYDHPQGPNNYKTNIPQYVIIDVPDFNPPSNDMVWDKNNPTHVPISPIRKRCKKHCCEVTFLPLTIAFALTLHKFQGWETSWKENSPVFYLLVDPGSIQDEVRAPGTFYAALSRPHTIGDLTSTPNKTSALYFIGDNICSNRIKNIGVTKSGKPTAFVQSRQLWVNFLHEQKTKTDNWISKNENNWMKTYETKIKNHSISKQQAESQILKRIETLKAYLV
ncbi:hypothetical protein HJC23_005173 [Cyclotella cryptica]|uniref:ATP-dependent DNA helicase n=1 Tax=Cyclotella cryptica TaxID=29204 RepID=A0ABD3QGZ0_9STRA|eukprot:CCRYP_005882-RB/>CCRYP_005882-RB protein AED:0.07 eAED:0.07 QI:2197/1/1/1/1/1/5/97/1828